MSDQIPPEDEHLWHKVTQSIRKTRSNRVNPNSPKPSASSAKKTQPPSSRQAAIKPPANHASPFKPSPNPHKIADLRHGETAGIDRLSARKLHTGKLPIDGRIDLHGLTQEQAQSQLNQFLLSASARGDRTVLVITGKGKSGQGILRNQLPFWLNQPPLEGLIVALDHAVARDGGAGAFYIRLKRKRDYS